MCAYDTCLASYGQFVKSQVSFSFLAMLRPLLVYYTHKEIRPSHSAGTKLFKQLTARLPQYQICIIPIISHKSLRLKLHECGDDHFTIEVPWF